MMRIMEIAQARIETPLINEHRGANARMEEFAGCLLPFSYSDFEQEYRAAHESSALFDTNWQAIFTLAGRDRVRYLHAISSNNIKDLDEGHGVFALLLNPQGRILAELEVYALKDKLLVLSHASVRERTFTTLKKYILGSQVQIEDLTGRFGSLAFEGPRAPALFAEIAEFGLTGIPELGIGEVSSGAEPCYAIRRSHFGEPGAEIVASREDLIRLWKSLAAIVRAQNGLPAGMKALNALRLEAGVPWFPLDFNDSVIPHEAVLENTHISFSKGCYTGQEIVERVRSRGHVNRKRVELKFSAAEPPPAGTKLLAGGVEAGYVTSSAFSPAVGTAIGMGYLRREHNAPGSIVEYDCGTAEVTGRKKAIENEPKP